MNVEIRQRLALLCALAPWLSAGCSEDSTDPGLAAGGSASSVAGASGMPVVDAGTDAGGVIAAQCEEIAGAAPNTLSIDVEGAAFPVPKEIFGVLLEVLGNNVNNGIYVGESSSIPNTRGVRDDIIEGFREAGVGAVQWPGGCAANNYDWQQNVAPPNTMGTDLFMDFAQWVDAEPYLVGRPGAEFAESNRQWVEYVNDNPEHPEWRLEYFKVGNEVWGCGGDLGHDAEGLATYETWYNANWEALNAPINGKQLFLVGATAGIWTINPNTDNWLTMMVEPTSLLDRIDGIEIHDYLYFPEASDAPIPNVGFTEAQYYNIVNLANEAQINPRIRNIKTILDRNDPEKRVKIMLDEWGDWLVEFDGSDTWLQKGTLMDAISAGIHLNVFMSHADRVLMAGLAQSTNVIHSLFMTNSSQGGTDLVKTPTFYVFQMFVPHHANGATWVPHELSSERVSGNGRSLPVLSVGTTVDASGGVNVSLVNVDLNNARTIDVTLEGQSQYAVSSARVITGPEKDAYNDFGQPEVVNAQPLDASAYQLCGGTLRVTLPSKSVSMFRLDRQ